MTKVDRWDYALIIFTALFALIVGFGLTDYVIYRLDEGTFIDRFNQSFAIPEVTKELRINWTGAHHLGLYTLFVMGLTTGMYTLMIRGYEILRKQDDR